MRLSPIICTGAVGDERRRDCVSPATPWSRERRRPSLAPWHLHHPHEDHVDEHALPVDDAHPAGHTAPAGGHDAGHVHGPDCGHPAVPHGDHGDYLVDGVLHHPHENHCDDHGPVTVVG